MSIKKNKKTSLILSLFLVFGILGPVQSGQESEAERVIREQKEAEEKAIKKQREAAEMEEANRKSQEEKRRQQENAKALSNAKEAEVAAGTPEQMKVILDAAKTNMDQATRSLDSQNTIVKNNQEALNKKEKEIEKNYPKTGPVKVIPKQDRDKLANLQKNFNNAIENQSTLSAKKNAAVTAYNEALKQYQTAQNAQKATAVADKAVNINTKR